MISIWIQKARFTERVLICRSIVQRHFAFVPVRWSGTGAVGSWLCSARYGHNRSRQCCCWEGAALQTVMGKNQARGKWWLEMVSSVQRYLCPSQRDNVVCALESCGLIFFFLVPWEPKRGTGQRDWCRPKWTLLAAERLWLYVWLLLSHY